MAKKSSVNKNRNRANLVAKLAGKRAGLKAQAANKDLPPEERFQAALKLAEMPRNSSKVRLRNRCELTGRSRAYYRKFRLSRIAFRDLASVGMIPGVTKSSW